MMGVLPTVGVVLTVLFTAVIAAATVVYVVFTRRLWKATSMTAEAAKLSADAARESADLARKSFEALHRPYLGVAEVRRASDPHDSYWQILFEVRNYGTLPAADTKVSVEVYWGSATELSQPAIQIGEVQPQAGLSRTVWGKLSDAALSAVERGELGVKVEVSYQGVGPSRYVHRAHFLYSRRLQGFEPRFSETKEVRS